MSVPWEQAVKRIVYDLKQEDLLSKIVESILMSALTDIYYDYYTEDVEVPEDVKEDFESLRDAIIEVIERRLKALERNLRNCREFRDLYERVAAGWGV